MDQTVIYESFSGIAAFGYVDRQGYVTPCTGCPTNRFYMLSVTHESVMCARRNGCLPLVVTTYSDRRGRCMSGSWALDESHEDHLIQYPAAPPNTPVPQSRDAQEGVSLGTQPEPAARSEPAARTEPVVQPEPATRPEPVPEPATAAPEPTAAAIGQEDPYETANVEDLCYLYDHPLSDLSALAHTQYGKWNQTATDRVLCHRIMNSKVSETIYMIEKLGLTATTEQLCEVALRRGLGCADLTQFMHWVPNIKRLGNPKERNLLCRQVPALGNAELDVLITIIRGTRNFNLDHEEYGLYARLVVERFKNDPTEVLKHLAIV